MWFVVICRGWVKFGTVIWKPGFQMPSEVLIIIGILDFELQFKLQDVIPKLETTLNASGPLIAI